MSPAFQRYDPNKKDESFVEVTIVSITRLAAWVATVAYRLVAKENAWRTPTERVRKPTLANGGDSHKEGRGEC